jgi:hypothetical protein
MHCSERAARPATHRATCLAAALVLIFAFAPAAHAQTTAPKARAQATAPKAGAQATAPKNDGGSCVGVVSAIGDTLTLKKVSGAVLYLIEERRAAIDSWRIDDFVVGKVSAVLGKQLNLRPVNYPKGAFAPLDEKQAEPHDRNEDVKAILQRITATTKCDHYIAILKTYGRLGTGRLSAGGLGIFYGAGIVFSNYRLYAVYTVRVYDGQNFSILAQKAASIGQLAAFTGFPGPSREVDETWWPTSTSDAAQSVKLRDGIRALVEQSLEMTLPELLQTK